MVARRSRPGVHVQREVVAGLRGRAVRRSRPVPVAFGTANGPPVQVAGSPPAETVPAAGCAASALPRYGEAAAGEQQQAEPAAIEARRPGRVELGNIG